MPLSISKMKTYTIPKGMVLIIVETLIYAGGASSMMLEEYEKKYKGKHPPQVQYFKKESSKKYPTDLSFQFTFQHSLAPICSYPGFAKPIWYKDQGTTIEPEGGDFTKYITRVNGQYNEKN